MVGVKSYSIFGHLGNYTIRRDLLNGGYSWFWVSGESEYGGHPMFFGTLRAAERAIRRELGGKPISPIPRPVKVIKVGEKIDDAPRIHSRGGHIQVAKSGFFEFPTYQDPLNKALKVSAGGFIFCLAILLLVMLVL